MVNNSSNISAYSGTPPLPSEDRLIQGGPLYDTSSILKILKKGDEFTIPWTRDCTRDIQNLDLDTESVRSLIKEAITNGKYLNSQWCVQKEKGPWAACDSYQLSRFEWIEKAHKEMRFEYYIKYAIGRTGKILLLVSCHN